MGQTDAWAVGVVSGDVLSPLCPAVARFMLTTDTSCGRYLWFPSVSCLQLQRHGPGESPPLQTPTAWLGGAHRCLSCRSRPGHMWVPPASYTRPPLCTCSLWPRLLQVLRWSGVDSALTQTWVQVQRGNLNLRAAPFRHVQNGHPHLTECSVGSVT